MPLHEFWHGDIRLLKAYRTAYLRDKSYTAWLIGAHTFEANSKAVANGNRTKRSDPVQQYADWKDPIERINKSKQKTEDFGIKQHKQNMWFYNMLHNK